MSRHVLPRVLFCAVVSVLISSPLMPLRAGWIENGTPICTQASTQDQNEIFPSGDNEVLIIWRDWRNWPPFDYFGQRIDLDGYSQWTVGGKQISPNGIYWNLPVFTADGEEGFFVAHRSHDYSDIKAYFQKVDGDGVPQWADSGVIVYPKMSVNQHALVSDGAGGFIVIWGDNRVGTHDNNVYVQRVDLHGTLLWGEDGVPVCVAPGTQMTARIASDGAGGAFLTWWDQRDENNHVYVQHVDGSGSLLWEENGRQITTNPSVYDRYPVLRSIAGGGVFVAWLVRTEHSRQIYIQKLDAAGNRLYTGEGVFVFEAEGPSYSSWVIQDGTGGLIILAELGTGTNDKDLKAQRISADGDLLWSENGLVIPEVYFDICPVIDGAGGLYLFWQDQRGGQQSEDIYGQYITAGGMRAWQEGGAPIIQAEGWQGGLTGISDGRGGAVITWTDTRTYSQSLRDIYAYRIRGTLPVSVDIRPGSCPNPLNPKSQGVLPVAILGTDEFDVASIDPKSVTLSGVSPWRWSYEDVAAPASKDAECDCVESHPDGIEDLVLKFSTTDLAEKLGVLSPGSTATLPVTGTLTDGSAFRGADCVIIRGEGSTRKPRERELHSVWIAGCPTDAIQRISCKLLESSPIEITVFDVSGRVVKRLEKSTKAAGEFVYEWNTAGLPSGMYFCRIVTKASVETRKIVLLR
jgi:hypothetical protein